MQSRQPAPIGLWFRADESDPGFDGVEVRFAPDSMIQVRDSKTRGAGLTLEFLPQEWEAFIRGVRQGEFDRPEPSMFDPAISGR